MHGREMTQLKNWLAEASLASSAAEYIAELEDQNQRLEGRIEDLESLRDELRERVTELEQELEAAK